MAFDLVAAIAAVERTGGGDVEIPVGRWPLTMPVTIPANVILWGHGASSVLVAHHVGDCLKTSFPLNASTPANITLRDFKIVCSVSNSIGAAFSEQGGSFVYAERVIIEKGSADNSMRFAYGIKLNQTEVAQFNACQISGLSKANVWILNGDQSGSAGYFTNRITISNCQINVSEDGVGIVDDGGNSHTIRECNFGGGKHQICAAMVLPLTITDCEFESASDRPASTND